MLQRGLWLQSSAMPLGNITLNSLVLQWRQTAAKPLPSVSHSAGALTLDPKRYAIHQTRHVISRSSPQMTRSALRIWRMIVSAVTNRPIKNWNEEAVFASSRVRWLLRALSGPLFSVELFLSKSTAPRLFNTSFYRKATAQKPQALKPSRAISPQVGAGAA